MTLECSLVAVTRRGEWTGVHERSTCWICNCDMGECFAGFFVVNAVLFSIAFDIVCVYVFVYTFFSLVSYRLL